MQPDPQSLCYPDYKKIPEEERLNLDPTWYAITEYYTSDALPLVALISATAVELMSATSVALVYGSSYGNVNWWALLGPHIFKTRVLWARGNGGLKALQVMAKYGILAHSINLGNYPCKITCNRLDKICVSQQII